MKRLRLSKMVMCINVRKIFLGLLTGLTLMATISCSREPDMQGAGKGLVTQSVMDTPLVLQETRDLVPGVQYRRYQMGTSDNSGYRFFSFGIARNKEEQKTIEECTARWGMSVTWLPFTFPGPASTQYHEAVAGTFLTREAVEAKRASYDAVPGCKPAIKASGLYPGDYSAPFLIHLLEIDPVLFNGRLVAMRKDGVAAGRVRPSTVMKAADGLAATNAGYFVMQAKDGVVGESTGISVLNGIMQSEPTRGRPWVSIENSGHIKVRFHRDEKEALPALVTADGQRIILDGINRRPGVLRNCGALQNQEASIAWHDVTCNIDDELIVLTDTAGFDYSPCVDELAFVLSRDGKLYTDFTTRFGEGDIQLIARGAKRKQMEKLVEAAIFVRLDLAGFLTGREYYAVNGGPMLLENGQKVRRFNTEGYPFGIADQARAYNLHRFVNLRYPRTSLSTAKDGKILITVIDGWRYREDYGPLVPMNGGATLGEFSEILLKLGAWQAINLDGGGSSTMVLPEGVVNHPSDITGERTVGDSLILLKKPHALSGQISETGPAT